MPVARKKSAPRTPEEYLRRLKPVERAALKKLRSAIRAAAPQATECIAYGLPSFRINGKYFVSYAAAARHCAFHLGSTIRKFPKELARFDLSKGSIRFAPARPLAKALVRRLVRARIAERPGFQA